VSERMQQGKYWSVR